jgi:uncharacterized protein (TIGR02246 family)
MTVPDGTTLRGWDEICAYHTARLAGPVSDWSTCVTVVSVNSLSAGTAVIQMKQDTTTPDRSFSNRGTIVAVKKDGQWWISALQNTNVA